MKKRLRSLLITTASLLVASRLIGSISFQEGEKTIFITALVFTIINLIIKPIIKLLLLPINLLTLGLFRWLINVFAFYLVLLLVPQLKIAPFLFPGFSASGFVVPEIQLPFFWTLVLVSFIISFTTSFLYWAFKK
jgi:putative membrane protein